MWSLCEPGSCLENAHPTSAHSFVPKMCLGGGGQEPQKELCRRVVENKGIKDNVAPIWHRASALPCSCTCVVLGAGLGWALQRPQALRHHAELGHNARAAASARTGRETSAAPRKPFPSPADKRASLFLSALEPEPSSLKENR